MTAAVILTEGELATCCREWQERLGLQSWRIGVAIARATQMDPNRDGEIEFHLVHRDALLRILDPADYKKNELFPQDMERTLVHELLHLKTESWQLHNETEEVLKEQFLTDMARALVTLKREVGK